VWVCQKLYYILDGVYYEQKKKDYLWHTQFMLKTLGTIFLKKVGKNHEYSTNITTISLWIINMTT